VAVIEHNDTYLIDGWDLSTAAVTIETAEGLQDGPEVIGDVVELPGLDGAYDPYGGPNQPRPAEGVGRIRFDLGLQGVDPATGQFLGGTDTAARYWALVDDLMRRAYRRRVLITHPRPDGDRVAVARLNPGTSVAPAREPASPWFGRCRLEFVIPGAHWTSTTPVTTGVRSLASGASLDLSVFAPATAPCTELLVRFYGAGANPQLATDYCRYKWQTTIAAGLQVQVDTATGLVSRGSGPAWPTVDGQPGYSHDYAPGPRLFEVDPAEPLTAVFTHTAGGSMGVEVLGRLRYRTS
jgi:hypothetical protein